MAWLAASLFHAGLNLDVVGVLIDNEAASVE